MTGAEIAIIAVGLFLATQIPRIMPEIDLVGVIFCVVGCLLLLAFIGVI